jgi:hypothetical protein
MFVACALTWKRVPYHAGLIHISIAMYVNFTATLWFSRVYNFPFLYPWKPLSNTKRRFVQESYLCGNVFANSFPRNAYMSQYFMPVIFTCQLLQWASWDKSGKTDAWYFVPSSKFHQMAPAVSNGHNSHLLHVDTCNRNNECPPLCSKCLYVIHFTYRYCPVISILIFSDRLSLNQIETDVTCKKEEVLIRRTPLLEINFHIIWQTKWCEKVSMLHITKQTSLTICKHWPM